MAEVKVAGESNEFKKNDAAKIDVPGAIIFISRALNRLIFLHEVTFDDDFKGSAAWWSLIDLKDNYGRSENALSERNEDLSAASTMVMNAQNDLEEVNALIYPENSPEWLKSKIKQAESVKWICKEDISCELAAAVDVFNFLSNSIFGMIGVVSNLSRSAFLGLGIIVDDLCNALREILSVLQQSYSKEEEVA